MILRLSSKQSDFQELLVERLQHGSVEDTGLAKGVAQIVANVRDHGDAALLDYLKKFEASSAAKISELRVDPLQAKRALNQLEYPVRRALESAAERIEAFHKKQSQPSWRYQDEYGNDLGQRVLPLDRVGLYVPGGKASYPSSVLMNAIPAKVAGVEEIVMVSPNAESNQMVLAAASLVGIETIFSMGGAQAVAALAYGTETVPSVDKIVGPGNAYVAEAKRIVFGKVGIDMIAGPSEILVLCDGETEVDWIIKDLFSQAEHDEVAQAILISQDAAFLDRVESAIPGVLADQPRKDIIEKSLNDRALFIHVESIEESYAIINQIAPEHLELSVSDPEQVLENIRHAGSVFMGRYTAEALGDYCAGPNHVLPTSGTARFASPLGVYDFQKRMSVIQCSQQGSVALGRIASTLARSESLPAHAQSAEARVEQLGDS